jgi:hypothetical protein
LRSVTDRIRTYPQVFWLNMVKYGLAHAKNILKPAPLLALAFIQCRS